LLEKEAALRDRGWLLERKLSWRLADALLRRPWANNVRDLRTLAQALVDLTPESATLLSLDPIAEFLPSQAAAEPAPGAASAADLEAPVRLRRQKSQRLTANDEAEIRRSLSRNHGNVKATEAETGVNERTIRRLAEKWRIGNKGDGGGGE
jgi:DNA-binding NtrC family response regulator